ncbi:hypothetical protein [Maribacter sp. 2308TA10-17]|uniref:hypothetical protein n=1 Tax=Maribacter sp. 2308TA10-17 TaxID=3386276 RepID=UPI0039BC2C86
MKITKLLAFALFLAVGSLSAQDIANHTIGLRLGDSDGFGAEISYQKSIGRYGRAELNLGYRDSREYDAVKAVLLFQSIYTISGGLNWYWGFGGGAGTASFESRPNVDDPNIIEKPGGGLFVLGAGDIGLEYNFGNLPLLISLDIRPEIGIIGYGGFDDRFDFDVGLGIRYQF